MAINPDMLTDLAGALDAARKRVTEINDRIRTLRNEAEQVKQIPPHTDDIVEAFRRGLDDAGKVFKTRMGWFLNNETAKNPIAANTADADSGHLLAGGSLYPHGNARLFPYYRIEDEIPLSFVAVSYFLRDRIADEIPALVAELAPAAKRGMRRADREEKFGSIIAEINALTDERDSLMQHLAAAQAVTGGVSPNSDGNAPNTDIASGHDELIWQAQVRAWGLPDGTGGTSGGRA